MSIAEFIDKKIGNLPRVQVRRRGQRRKLKRRDYILVSILLFLALTGTLFSLFAYQTYHTRYQRDVSLAQTGIQHLRKAQTFLAAYPQNYLNDRPISQAQQEFTSASQVFTQINNDLTSLPGFSTLVPGYGTQVKAALQLIPIALEVSQAGLLACNVLNLSLAEMHSLAGGRPITVEDFAVIQEGFSQMSAVFQQVVSQVNHLQPDVLKIDHRLTAFVSTFQKELPMLKAWQDEANNLLAVIPTLLGLSSPTNYLVELLDSSELRPGGGFIGNYGVATLSGGKLQTANIRDTYLLDKPFVAAGHSIAFPAAYAWFPLSSEGWSLRDSNLDADFPTAAAYAEQIYKEEGGNIPVQGVIAITPGFIQHALEITGPINIPEYHETVSAQNLTERIHYYQLVVDNHGEGYAASPDGHSSVRKNFTSLLAEHFLTRIHQLPPTEVSKFLTIFVNGFRSKDIQVYLNSASGESVLHQLHFDGAIQQSSGDNFYVVDANIGLNKANDFISNTLNDQVSIDASGNAMHQTTLTYAWNTPGPIYGPAVYQDYVRVYVPSGSLLQTQDGWEPRGTSVAFGHEVWAGFLALPYGQTLTITLTWTAPNIAKKSAQGWQYQELIQRQAGTLWKLNLQVTLPSCATITSKQGGLVSENKQKATLTHFLSEATNVELNYTC
jgi:hypothetical protein